MYAVSLIFSNLSPHYLPFSSFQGKCSFSTDNGIFHCHHRWWLSFPLNLFGSSSPTRVTTCLDSCKHRQLNPKPCIFTIWQVEGRQQSTRRPPPIRMQNRSPFITNLSSPGDDSRGGVFHKWSDIYPLPPQIGGC